MLPATALTLPANDRSAIAIIGSAGGIPAMIDLLAVLPADFPIPIILAQHLAREAPSILPDILSYRSRLRAKWAEPGEVPMPGVVYVVPAGRQLKVTAAGFASAALSACPRDWVNVPDLLLRSMAEFYGAGAIGIALSGMLPVGIAGFRAIYDGGGITMAQSERSSRFFDMPCAAIDLGRIDIVLSPARIAEALIALASERETAAA
jgi:two-component system, chemotaxis family, protein-glutamate methylesterase/glutaminase